MSLSVEHSRAVAALPLMEHFYTIQGEGAYTGYPAYFLRLAGCDVGCVWCDVKESWSTEGYPRLKPAELSALVEASGAPLAVITGGEPTLYDLNSLTQSLKNLKVRVHLETSGAHEIRGDFDWICLSPKKFKPPLASAYAKAHELKVVVYNKHDFKWAETHAAEVPEHCQLFLQPEWSRHETMLPQIIDYVKANPKWRISLQTHKFMRIP